MAIRMPLGAELVEVDEHETHPVRITYENGKRTRAKTLIWDDEPAPEGTWKIDDEREIDANDDFI